MNLSETETKSLVDLKRVLRAQGLGLAELRLFGSKARGDFDPESDIDIAVILDKVNQSIEQQVFDTCFEISLRYDLLLAPIVLSRAEMSNRRRRGTPFFQTLEREGVLV